jgi:hypothetical protein
MSYHIEYIPQPHDRSKHSKGNGGKNGRIDGHNRNPNDVGMDYRDGMGCSRHDNCFTCPFDDCQFQRKSGCYSDLSYITNRGDGIKVW